MPSNKSNSVNYFDFPSRPSCKRRMSQSVSDLRRRQAALSTNGRDFVPSMRLTDAPRENLYDEDDEDIRLEKYRSQQKATKTNSIVKHESRGKRNINVFEDSPNGYEITVKAPPETERAIKFYSFHLRHFTATEHLEEYGMIHYALGKVFFADRKTSGKDYEERAKFVENALHHFRIALEIFEYNSFPIMFGVICTFIGQLFRERATMITDRSILAKRGVTVADSVRIGISHLEEAIPALTASKFHTVEYALCSLELGWLYVMQITDAMSEEIAVEKKQTAREMARAAARRMEAAGIAREQAVLCLERALVLVKQACDTSIKEGKPRGNQWVPSDKQTHPHHIKLLLREEPLNLLDGVTNYLLGRCYQDSSPTLDNQLTAFNHFCKAVKPGNLPMEWEEWADSHHRAAGVAVKYPQVIDPDFGTDPQQDTDLCYLSAVSHLSLALRCSSLRPPRRLDLLFHLAQAHIARLYMITDRVPPGKSTLVALSSQQGGEGLEIIANIKKCLVEAIKGSTAANMESTQDAYVYFFSCLKLSELRMLEAAAIPSLDNLQRDKLLEQSVVQLVNALLARSLVDNSELHYIAVSQMSAMLAASKRHYAATKCYGKVLLCLSILSNRLAFLPVSMRNGTQCAVWEELEGQTTQSLLASSKEIEWTKNHLGAIFLTEAVTSGFAYWSYEAHDGMKVDRPSGGQDSGAPIGVLTYTEALANRAPPSLLPGHLSDTDRLALEKQRLSGKKTDGFAPPAGSVPLWAMGHHPDFEGQDSVLKSPTTHASKTKGFFLGLRRLRVPHLVEILSKSTNIVTHTDSKRDVVYLMPLPTLSSTAASGDVNAKVSFKIKDQHIEDYMRNKTKAKQREKASKKGLFSRWFGRQESEADTGLEGSIGNISTPDCTLYASIQGFYSLMVLSRQGRTILTHTCARLQVGKGQRAAHSYSLLPEYMKSKLETLQQNMKTECASLHIPSFTLRALSERTFDDLTHAFQSQVALCRVASDMEALLVTQISQVDYFLPITLCSQALTRDIGSFDASLLNAKVLISNLRTAEERKLAKAAEAANSAAVAASAAAALIADEIDAKTFGKSIVESSSSEYAASKSASRVTDTTGSHIDTGGMTFALSQTLDGASSSGTIHALSSHLDKHEAMLVWHLPALPGVGMQLLLIWKDPKDEAMAYPTTKKNKSKRKKATNENTLDGNGSSENDLVMEVLKTEVDCIQVEYLIRNWLVALQGVPEVKRVAHATDALRSLSCYLALTGT